MNPQDTRLSSEERAALKKWMCEAGRMEQLEKLFEVTDRFEGWLMREGERGTVQVRAEDKDAAIMAQHLIDLHDALAPLRKPK